MLIEAYFQLFASWISSYPFIVTSDINYQARRPSLGFIRGEMQFRDGSILHVREFVDVEDRIDRLAYAYQYMTSTGHLIFRYDNADHHKYLQLATHPHHKHDGAEDRIVASSIRDFSAVLQEIERTIPFN